MEGCEANLYCRHIGYHQTSEPPQLSLYQMSCSKYTEPIYILYTVHTTPATPLDCHLSAANGTKKSKHPSAGFHKGV